MREGKRLNRYLPHSRFYSANFIGCSKEYESQSVPTSFSFNENRKSKNENSRTYTINDSYRKYFLIVNCKLLIAN